MFRDNNGNLREHEFLGEKAFRNSSTRVENFHVNARDYLQRRLITRSRVEVEIFYRG